MSFCSESLVLYVNVSYCIFLLLEENYINTLVFLVIEITHIFPIFVSNRVQIVYFHAFFKRFLNETMSNGVFFFVLKNIPSNKFLSSWWKLCNIVSFLLALYRIKSYQLVRRFNFIIFRNEIMLYGVSLLISLNLNEIMSKQSYFSFFFLDSFQKKSIQTGFLCIYLSVNSINRKSICY